MSGPLSDADERRARQLAAAALQGVRKAPRARSGSEQLGLTARILESWTARELLEDDGRLELARQYARGAQLLRASQLRCDERRVRERS